jgi:nitrogen PTS system EIIA component
MELGDLLTPDAIIPALKAETKKDVLLALAERAGQASNLDAQTIYAALLHRERLSSTALGKGIAVPHTRLAGIEHIVCVFARLEQPIDFEAPDKEPVDLVFLLLAPESAGADHLNALARISRMSREPAILDTLRGCRTRSAMFSVLGGPMNSSNAA